MDLSTLERIISSLEESLAFWETWLTISTLFVVVGLILEYWHEVRELIKARPFKWKALMRLTGAVLVTGGVAGELWVQFRASRVEDSLRTANHEIEARLRTHAENEASARARLEERLGGWRLDSEAQARLIERLKPFKGTPFDFWVNPDESSLLNTMDGILRTAGWKWEKPKQSLNEFVTILLSNKAAILYVSGLRN